jgi:hypothetical protein
METNDAVQLDHGRPKVNNLPMLVVSWLLVGVPAAWGITQTFKQSLKLFAAPPAATTAATQTAPPP